MGKETLNNGISKLSFRDKLNSMFTEIYYYIAGLVKKSTDLSDMPLDLTGFAGKILQVKSTEDGYELVIMVKDSTDLRDMPGSLSGNAGKILQVKSTGDSYELVIPVKASIDLNDMPSSLMGGSGRFLKVGTDEESYVIGTSRFVDNTDTPSSYIGASGKILGVNPGGTQIEFKTGLTVTRTWYDNSSQRNDQIFTNGLLTSWTVTSP